MNKLIITLLLVSTVLLGCSKIEEWTGRTEFKEERCTLTLTVNIADDYSLSSHPAMRAGSYFTEKTVRGVSAVDQIWVTGDRYNYHDKRKRVLATDYRVLGHELQHQLNRACPDTFADPDVDYDGVL